VDASTLPSGQLALGGLNGGSGPIAALANTSYSVAPRAGRFTFKVTYATAAGVDVASLDGNDIHLTGPNGFSATADLLKTRVSRDREFVTATYAYGTPAHRWSSDESGVYSIALSSGQVKDLAGVAAVGGLIGSFVVDA